MSRFAYTLLRGQASFVSPLLLIMQKTKTLRKYVIVCVYICRSAKEKLQWTYILVKSIKALLVALLVL